MLWVRNQQGNLVPLSSLVRPHVKTGPEIDQPYQSSTTSVTIFYNLKPGYPPTELPPTNFRRWQKKSCPLRLW